MYIFASLLYIYTLMTKNNRHKIIKEVLQTSDINSQEMLLKILIEKGFSITQATLSRDINELKIVKVPTAKGSYTYQLPENIQNIQQEELPPLSSFGFLSIEFSGNLAVIKTRPGYAMAIAGEIDNKATQYILGTVAGDDTILLIPRDNVSRNEVLASLSAFIPNIQ
ncbi:arginine repressor [Dysgonomonas sp. BGC7]|uniref:arginine repressor n=2 Tax=Dysgonomonas sp. BGC7 TaxID=1658008 RepID=UPI0006813701|nr:arginine repressor [Dysgonomonas sp. BGC7]MBD8389254.1 arginine repressor [Dysgonomonas sp. BGC7]